MDLLAAVKELLLENGIGSVKDLARAYEDDGEDIAVDGDDGIDDDDDEA